MNVVPIGVPSVNDIPARLRELAEAIEAGMFDAVGFVYAMHTPDAFYASSIGKIGPLEAVGLASLAHQHFSQMVCRDDDP